MPKAVWKKEKASAQDWKYLGLGVCANKTVQNSWFFCLELYLCNKGTCLKLQKNSNSTRRPVLCFLYKQIHIKWINFGRVKSFVVVLYIQWFRLNANCVYSPAGSAVRPKINPKKTQTYALNLTNSSYVVSEKLLWQIWNQSQQSHDIICGWCLVLEDFVNIRSQARCIYSPHLSWSKPRQSAVRSEFTGYKSWINERVLSRYPEDIKTWVFLRLQSVAQMNKFLNGLLQNFRIFKIK